MKLPALALLVLASITAQAQSRSPEIARTISANSGLQGRVMWVDATANLDRITTREGVNDIVARCKKANINVIVVDVKPVVGQVLYNSKFGERLRTWKGKTYPDFDVLAAFVEEGHKKGMEVAATLHVFSEGHKYFNSGLAYSKPEWQSKTYTVDRNLVAADGSRLPIRASADPDDPTKTLILRDDKLQEPTKTPGKDLAIVLDADRRVAGVIDPALLQDEPLVAPEEGYMLVLNEKQKEWASKSLQVGELTTFTARGKLMNVTDAGSEKVAAFVNPLHPDARAHEIGLIKEIAQNYDLDTLVFDRMRYANVYNDYSDLTRTAFEKWLGKPVKNWPEDVISFNMKPGLPEKRGPLFKQFLEFRARVIREFVRETTETVRAIKPKMQFGVYVGSWFTSYFGVGVNWGSEKFEVRTSWATKNYNEAGYAEFLDWISTGCYYAMPTREDARRLNREDEGTVEAAAELSTIAVANAAPVYAGVYVLQYAGQPELFEKAVEVAARKSQGVMLFDISHIYEFGFWDILYRVFDKPVAAPHRDPGLTAQIRAIQDAIRSTLDGRGSGARLPVVPYQPGGG